MIARFAKAMVPLLLAVSAVPLGVSSAGAAAPAHHVRYVVATLDAQYRLVSARQVSAQQFQQVDASAAQNVRGAGATPQITGVACQDGIRDDFWKFHSTSGDVCFANDGTVFPIFIPNTSAVATGNNAGNFNDGLHSLPGNGLQFCPWLEIGFTDGRGNPVTVSPTELSITGRTASPCDHQTVWTP